mmetsp:Transcript_102789/g.297159  ORF Transcript_102789/g.297159 Transcript_102789/m.297159 type:complete len:590 (+) Transcript_102789:100-1869(+)
MPTAPPLLVPEALQGQQANSAKLAADVEYQSGLMTAAAAAAGQVTSKADGAGAAIGNWCRADVPAPIKPLAYRRVCIARTQKDTEERISALGPLPLRTDAPSLSQDPSVFVFPNAQAGKPWIGFGGSFTESATHSLRQLGQERWNEVVKAYFDPEHGLGYTIGRVHIGSCDFSLSSWTCGDLKEGDHELEDFSLDYYETLGILPMIREASALAKEPIQLLASPWSPPPWMKTKRQYEGDGHLLPECRGVWALHYVKFVKEMAKRGIPIWAISIQNEPEAAQIWESCIYSATEERDFIRDHLGPTMHQHGLEGVRILFWDHNRDGMLERAAITYADLEAAKYIWGMCWHWYGDPRFETWPPRHEVSFTDRQQDEKAIFELKGRAGFDNVRKVAELRPDKHLIFSEGCQELSGRPLSKLLGDWKLGERYALNIINDVNSGCEGFIDWNLCLDEEGGPNHVGNTCAAAVICDSASQKVLYQPIFWYIGQFSRYIRPGARRVSCSTSRDTLEVTAFVNPDGRLAVVVMNQSDLSESFWLKVACDGGPEPFSSVWVDAPARSIVTLVADDKVAEEAPETNTASAQQPEPWQAKQ